METGRRDSNWYLFHLIPLFGMKIITAKIYLELKKEKRVIAILVVFQLCLIQQKNRIRLMRT